MKIKKRKHLILAWGNDFNGYIKEREYDVHFGKSGKEVFVATPEAVFEIQLPGNSCQKCTCRK